MSFLVHVPGMKEPNTRGLLGNRLSSPVTPTVFGPFMPGTCICSHNYSIIYEESNVQEGNIRKGGAFSGESLLTGSCSGHWTGREPGQGAGAGVENKTPRPGLLTRAGRGIEAGAGQFRGPRGPVTNSSTVSTPAPHGRILKGGGDDVSDVLYFCKVLEIILDRICLDLIRPSQHTLPTKCRPPEELAILQLTLFNC